METREATDTPIVVEAPTNELGVAVVCRERGLLFVSEPHGFLESISLSIGMGGGPTLQYQIPATSARRPAETIAVSPISEWHHTAIGNLSTPLDAPLRRAAILHRQLRNEEKEFWFEPDEIERATEQVREMTRRATREVLFADPYFSVVDFSRFALGIGHPQVRIRVLTSKEAFPDGDAARARFVKTIEEVIATRRAQRLTVEVRQMAETEIHDRFIGVDNDLWLVGRSFNDLGGRGTMIVQLRTAKRTRLRLEASWDRAKPLQELT